MLAWLRCFFRRHHAPHRHYLGGFRCSECGAVGATLEDMGFDGSVPPLSRVFLENGRTTSWETGLYHRLRRR